MGTMGGQTPPPNASDPSDNPFPSILGVQVGAWESKRHMVPVSGGITLLLNFGVLIYGNGFRCGV